MRLLLVEDNDRMRQLIRSVLEGFVSDIHECTGGDEALAAYAQCQPDWVLMDIKMPRMDGITATRQIMQEWPEAKVVMLTDYDDDELRAAALSAGACDYVLKEDLRLLRRLLQGQG
jgi:CheY-like chemotaxis protein